ncbi:hypothetical protein BGZ83_010862 [Gryganskiella cystojenkinii]|nr:hypothetical protein BGZ83_010862 [Gryganskiella cystojenkinii]
MSTSERSLTRVIRLPELFDAIVQYLDLKNFHVLRLVNTLFHDQCVARFSITLDLESLYHQRKFENLAESALAIKDGPGHEQLDPLDLIQGLKISRNRYTHKSMTPETVSILNQCRNLRHIHINDDPGSRSTSELSEEPSNPARLFWSSMFPVVQGAWRAEGNADDGDLKDGKHDWTFWDLLPLEGSLFDRLQSLTFEVHYHSQLNFDQFMTRLGRSHAAKSLDTLTIISSLRTCEVFWEIFRDCICNLSMLKSFTMEGIKVSNRKQLLTEADDGSQHKMATQQRQVAPTVKSLSYRYGNGQDPDTKLALMSLFPNLESLKLTDLDALLGKAVDERIFFEVGDLQLPLQQSSSSTLESQLATGPVKRNDASLYPIPFPRLRFLDFSNFSAKSWEESQVLRHWVKRTPAFRISVLWFDDREANSGLHEELSAYSATVTHLTINIDDKDIVKTLLTSRLCRNLRSLSFRDRKLDCASVIFECLQVPAVESAVVILDPAMDSTSFLPLPSQASMSLVPLPSSQHDTFTRLPWIQTLTRICFRDLSYTSSMSNDESLAVLRSFLTLLPRLTDFEVQEPILDLSFFDGLGRQVTCTPTANGVGSPTVAVQGLEGQGSGSVSVRSNSTRFLEFPTYFSISIPGKTGAGERKGVDWQWRL